MANNMRLYYELSRILRALQQQNISTIVLKGAHLAEEVYSKIALRPMVDVDLLFREEDVSSAQQVILDLGYAPFSPRLAVDVHWRLESSNRALAVNMKGVWRRATETLIANVPSRVLCPEDLLLHLCLHIVFHHHFSFNGLRTLCDLRAVVSRYQDRLDWEQLAARAHRWKASHAAYLVLLLTQNLLHTPIPLQALSLLQPPSWNPKAEIWAREQLFAPPDLPTPFSPNFWRFWQSDSWGERLLLLRQLFFPSPRYISQHFPASEGSLQNYLHYFSRFNERSAPYLRLLWRLLRRDPDALHLIERKQRDLLVREWLNDS